MEVLIAVVRSRVDLGRAICNQFSRHREQRRADRGAAQRGGDCRLRYFVANCGVDSRYFDFE